MAVKPRFGLMLVALLLAGCGAAKEAPMMKVLGSLFADFKGKGPAVDIRSTPRSELEKPGLPVMFLSVPAWQRDVLLLPSSTRGTIINWVTADGTVLTQRDGVLIQTRGLGPDLMSAAAPSAAQLLAGGRHSRSYFPLGANDTTPRLDFDCESVIAGSERIVIFGRSHDTRKVVETCHGQGRAVTNRYWFEGGKIRQSEEWVSPEMGNLHFAKAVD